MKFLCLRLLFQLVFPCVRVRQEGPVDGFFLLQREGLALAPRRRAAIRARVPHLDVVALASGYKGNRAEWTFDNVTISRIILALRRSKLLKFA